MQRINEQEVELTSTENVVQVLFNYMIDDGWSADDALAAIKADCSAAVISAEFESYLRER